MWSRSILPLENMEKEITSGNRNGCIICIIICNYSFFSKSRSKFVCNTFQKCLPEVNLAQNGQLDFLLNINQVLLTTGSNVKIASDLKFRSPGMGWNAR